MHVKPRGKDSLFPDLAPYGPVRRTPIHNLPKEPETNEIKPAIDKRFQLGERFSKKNAPINQTTVVKPKKQRSSKLKSKKKVYVTLIAFIIFILCAGISIYAYTSWKQSIPPALSQDSIGTLNFQVYYPSRMPPGFRFKKGSISSQNGLFFYKFINGKKVITVTEQVAPPKSFKLTNLKGYTSISVPIGKAATGTSVGNPSVIIVTDTTLVNITSTKGVPKENVFFLAQKMELFVPPGSL